MTISDFIVCQDLSFVCARKSSDDCKSDANVRKDCPKTCGTCSGKYQA